MHVTRDISNITARPTFKRILETDEAPDAGCKEAATYLATVESRLQDDGLSVQSEVVVHSRPAFGILGYAREKPIDLIAIATRGRGGVPRLLLGSVADRVTRVASAPVVVTRPPRTQLGVAARVSSDSSVGASSEM